VRPARGGSRRGSSPGRRPAFLRDWRAVSGIVLLVVAVVIALLVLRGGSDGGPLAGRAADLVPADTLAYLDVSTDGDRSATTKALTLLRRLGAEQTVTDQLDALLGGDAAAQPVAFSRDVRPWLGDEAALALTRGVGTTAGSLLLLSVADEDGAREFLARTSGHATTAAYHGTPVSAFDSGAVTAFVDGFLVIGQQRSVRAAIDLAAGSGGGRGRAGSRSLAADPTYRRASAGEPADRALDAYASVDGVRRLLAPQSGLLGLAGALLDQRGLLAAGMSVSARGDTASVHVRQVLDPRQHNASSTFTPTLTRLVPRSALAYAGFAGLQRALPLLLGVSGISGLTGVGGAGGLGADTATLIRQAGRLLADQGVSFARDILPLLGGEVAVALVQVDRAPGVVLLASVPDEGQARTALRGLEPAIARLFAPASGPAPSFTDVRAGAAAARQLKASGGVELDYAVGRGVLAVSTSADALSAVLAGSGSIADSPAFKTVISDPAAKATSIVFFDFSQLLSLFEPKGSTDSGLATELRRIRTAGFTSTSGESQTTAELTFEIP
jgi:hypothetical protein